MAKVCSECGIPRQKTTNYRSLGNSKCEKTNPALATYPKLNGTLSRRINALSFVSGVCFRLRRPDPQKVAPGDAALL